MCQNTRARVYGVSEWVIKFNGLSRTADSGYMEHGSKHIMFYVQKHIAPLAMCHNPALVRDKLLGVPESVKMVYTGGVWLYPCHHSPVYNTRSLRQHQNKTLLYFTGNSRFHENIKLSLFFLQDLPKFILTWYRGREWQSISISMKSTDLKSWNICGHKSWCPQKYQQSKEYNYSWTINQQSTFHAMNVLPNCHPIVMLVHDFLSQMLQ